MTQPLILSLIKHILILASAVIVAIINITNRERRQENDCPTRLSENVPSSVRHVPRCPSSDDRRISVHVDAPTRETVSEDHVAIQV